VSELIDYSVLTATIGDLERRVSDLESSAPIPSLPHVVPSPFRNVWVQATGNRETARGRVRDCARLGATHVTVFTGTGAGVVYENSAGIPVTESLSATVDEATSLGLAVLACIPVKYMCPPGMEEWDMRYTEGWDLKRSWLDLRVPDARSQVAVLTTDLRVNYPSIFGVCYDYCRWDRFKDPFGIDNAQYITQMVRQGYEACGDHCYFTLSPISIWSDDINEWDARRYGQYWPEWLKEGICHFLTPMCYSQLGQYLDRWTGTPVFPSQSVPVISPCINGDRDRPRTDQGWQVEMDAVGQLDFSVFDRSLCTSYYPDKGDMLRAQWS